MNYTIQDIIDGAVSNEPVKIATAFDSVIGPKIQNALEARRQEIARSLFINQDEIDDQENDTEEEVADENITTTTEEN